MVQGHGTGQGNGDDDMSDEIPPEVLDLTRFMCQTWSALQDFFYQQAKDGNLDVGSWPQVQGTRNQLNLTRIGEQPFDTKKLAVAVAWMMENKP